MNILYSTDNNFAKIMAVSIQSPLNNHKGIKVNVYVLDSGISELNKTKIDSLFMSDKHKLHIIKNNSIVDVVADRGSMAQFSRLFFDQYLPDTVRRVLYLDCDTLVLDELTSFYYMDMKEKMIVLAKDPFSKGYRSFLRLEKNADMFNSGIMLIDRDKWNELNTTERIKKAIDMYNGKIIQGDQGIIDIVSQENYIVLNPEYNVISSYYEFNYKQLNVYRKPVNFYTDKQIKYAVENPKIVHFTSDFLNNRPWIKGSNHPFRKEWQLKEREIFGSNSVQTKSNKVKKIFEHFPKVITISFLGILQAYVRPLIFKLKGY